MPASAKAIGALLVLFVILYMLVPMLVVIGASVNAAQFLVFPPRGLSLRWYAEVLASERYRRAAVTSIELASTVTVLALLIGTPAAIALMRRRLPWSGLWGALLLSPLIVPTILFGIGLLMLFSIYADGPSFVALVIGHTVITLPYVVRTVAAVLAQADPHLEEAARVMGAPWWRRYWHVVLPQCRPGMVAGAFFAFNVSFDEAVVALFLRAPGLETLPLRIYSELEFSPTPGVAAVSTLMILITLALILVVERVLGLRRVVQ